MEAQTLRLTKGQRRKTYLRSAPAFLAIAIAVTLYPLFLGQFYGTGDMADVFIPLEHFFHTETLAGRLPAWNPDSAWGYPVIAAAQIGYFYPPLLVLRLLPLYVYLPFILLGHLFALALGAYLCMRALKTSPAAAYLGSISFTLGSFTVQHLTHLNIIITATWLPWQLLFVRATATKKKPTTSDLARLAIVFGLPFLAGQLHIPTLMALVSSAYFIYLKWQTRQTFRSSFKILLLTSLLALLLSAAQLLPTAELATQSARGPSGDFDLSQANQHSFPLYHVPTLIFPRFYGNDDTYWGKRLQIEYGIFIGTIPLVLALWYIASRGKQKRNQFWVGLLVVTFLLSLGSLSPFRLLGLEPSLWVFSAPARWLLFTTFALALFAARGFDQAPWQKIAFRRFARSLAFGFVLLSSLTTLILFTVDKASLLSLPMKSLANTFENTFQRSPDYYTQKIDSLVSSAQVSSLSLASPYTALPLLLLVALPLIVTRKNGHIVILAATTVELIAVAATTNPTVPWQTLRSAPPALTALPSSVQNKQSRTLAISPPGDTGKYLTNPETRANTISRNNDRKLLKPLTNVVFQVPGIEWPASLPLADHSTALDQIRDGEGNWFQEEAEKLNVGAVLTPNYFVSPTTAPHSVSENITLYQLDPVPRASTADQSPVTYQEVTPSHIQLNVNVEQATILTIRDSFYPGWRATVNGEAIAVNRTEKIFRSLAIPAGQLSITLRYQPTIVYVGVGMSVLAALLCGILMLKPKSL